MDTLPHVPRHFWRDWTAAIKAEYPSVNVLGELFDGDPALLSYFQRGRTGHDGIDAGIDTLYDFPVHYAVRDAFAKGESVRKLAQVLAHDHLYTRPEALVPFVGVHDMLRFMSEKGATVEGLKLAQTFVMTTRGTPLLYYGDELAMPGGADPDNRRDFPGGFPGDPRNAFTKAGRTDAENDVHDHLRRLGQLRAELAPLRRGSLLHLYDEEQQTAFARVHGGEAVIIAFNNDTKPASFTVRVDDLGLGAARLRERLGVLKSEVLTTNGVLALSLPPRSSVILTAERRSSPIN
jgi:glycosidase